MEGITISEVQLLNSCFRLEKENNQLRELLRWRVFKEEKPNRFGRYLICDSDGCDIHIGHWRVDETWSHGVSLKYWRPIGSLPGGGGE